MIKLATVVSQKPSLAKKGLYITVLKDEYGELRAYSTRQLKPDESVVISVQSGAANDPLAVTILNKNQAAAYIDKLNAKAKETTLDDNSPEVSAEAIRSLIEDALDKYVDGWDDVDNDTFAGWFTNPVPKRELMKAIHAKARELNYAVEGTDRLEIYSTTKDYPKIEVNVSLYKGTELDPHFTVTLYEVM